MSRRDDIVCEARLWIGTPYRHQQATLGAGSDCLGLLRGVWRSVYGAEPAALPAYTPDWDEVAGTDVLWTAADRFLIRREDRVIFPGDVLLFRMRRNAVAKHLGIASSETGFIHAYSGHGVIENALSDPWRRRIAGVFAFPDMD